MSGMQRSTPDRSFLLLGRARWFAVALAVLVGVGLWVTTSGGGAGAAPARHAPSSSCPFPRPTTSSIHGETNSHATSATFCVYLPGRIAKTRYSAESLQRILGAAVQRLPRNMACATVTRAPAIVVLDYTDTTRYVALDMDGCPSVIAKEGGARLLIGRAGAQLLSIYERTVRRA